MEINDQIDKEEVVKEFDKRALNSSGIDAVLDASGSADASFSNIYRDFITKYYLAKYVHAKKNEVLLDYGCGIGRISNIFSPKCQQVYATDISKEMINKAIEINSKPNIDYFELTHLENKIKDHSIDKIYICWVFQHINENQFEEIIKMFKRKLKPQGKVILFEQINVKSFNNKIINQRIETTYINKFDEYGFSNILNKKIFKMPSYGLDFWKRLNKNYSVFLYLSLLVERLTINYKNKNLVYSTQIFVFTSKK